MTSEAKTVDGKRFRKDGRTRTIFENCTESTMLYRSLAKAFYKDVPIVSETARLLGISSRLFPIDTINPKQGH